MRIWLATGWSLMIPTVRSSLAVAGFLVLTVAGSAFLTGARRAQQSAGDSPAVQDRIEAAKLLAGNDPNFKQTLSLTRDRQHYQAYLAEMGQHVAVSQIKAFDQLYYLGMNTVGSWALVTSDGIIQIDALDNAEEAQRIIIGGYKKLGLDPRRMKYLIVSHGHFDHFGGAKYLQETYHPRVLMGEADWEMVEKPQSNGRTLPAPPKRDMVARDGQKLTLGNTTLTLYITPGHTPSTISMLIPVTDGGRPHLLSYLGGTYFSADPDLLEQQEISLERFTKIGEDAAVDGYISNHPFFDNTFTDGKTDKQAKALHRNTGNPHPNSNSGTNPWIVGQGTYVRYMIINLECLEAEQARRQHPAK